MTMQRKLISIVPLFYNERESVEFLYTAISKILDQISSVGFEAVCVDDGSCDDTLMKLVALVERDSRPFLIELSRNFGFAEFFPVCKGTRGIFVEPLHTAQPFARTVAFVEAQKMHDPSWIERDVVLEEIDQIARAVGFTAGLGIVLMQAGLLALQTYSMGTWSRFRDRDALERLPDRSACESQLLGSHHFLCRQTRAMVKANDAHRL